MMLFFLLQTSIFAWKLWRIYSLIVEDNRTSTHLIWFAIPTHIYHSYIINILININYIQKIRSQVTKIRGGGVLFHKFSFTIFFGVGQLLQQNIYTEQTFHQYTYMCMNLQSQVLWTHRFCFFWVPPSTYSNIHVQNKKNYMLANEKKKKRSQNTDTYFKIIFLERYTNEAKINGCT